MWAAKEGLSTHLHSKENRCQSGMNQRVARVSNAHPGLLRCMHRVVPPQRAMALPSYAAGAFDFSWGVVKAWVSLAMVWSRALFTGL